ncbi:hypothetical protein MJO52_16920 [Microbulbifer variabilis]|uniref:Uncharacterized protein n=1 Tax=Microbulbifer variabilis TaxID=266805 RepID=A0ABY4VE67_9GAMM|nr:hypothetical protein [Microbulbifer variabilis]USD20732.1 hypothetical protein MJO52_16920 [Microbulbifer variabilis]
MISLFLGAACIQLVIMRYLNGEMAPQAFAAALEQLIRTEEVPAALKSLAIFFTPHITSLTYSLHFAILLAGVLLILRVLMTLGALLMFVSFILLWGFTYMGENSWFFEFLSPALYALVLAVSSCSFTPNIQKPSDQASSYPTPYHQRLLGSILAPDISFLSWCLWVIVASSVFFAIFLMSRNGGNHILLASLLSSITIAVLVILSKFLDRYRMVLQTEQSNLLLGRWINLFTITIGVMLIFQVYEDSLLNWFTVEGYRGLVDSYVEYGNTPLWFRNALAWVAEHANIFMPIQRIFEVSAAICMVILVFRFPIFLLTTGLFAILSFTEFGVTNVWPPAPGKPPAWVFELLLTTLVSLTCGLYYLFDALKCKSWRYWLLGSKVFESISKLDKYLLFILFFILEIIVFSVSPSSKENDIIALHLAALTLIPLFYILILIDIYRKDSTKH